MMNFLCFMHILFYSIVVQKLNKFFGYDLRVSFYCFCFHIFALIVFVKLRKVVAIKDIENYGLLVKGLNQNG